MVNILHTYFLLVQVCTIIFTKDKKLNQQVKTNSNGYHTLQPIIYKMITSLDILKEKEVAGFVIFSQ